MDHLEEIYQYKTSSYALNTLTCNIKMNPSFCEPRIMELFESRNVLEKYAPFPVAQNPPIFLKPRGINRENGHFPAC